MIWIEHEIHTKFRIFIYILQFTMLFLFAFELIELIKHLLYQFAFESIELIEHSFYQHVSSSIDSVEPFNS